MFCFHLCWVFKWCCFKFMPVTVPFSKSTVFKICRQKMCRFRVNGRPIRRIFHRFQNVPASCERSLSLWLIDSLCSRPPDRLNILVLNINHVLLIPQPAKRVDLWRWVSCFPVLFDLMMALRSIETHSITMKNLALFRPKLSNFFSTNQIARFSKEQCCRIFNSNDAVD